MMRRRISIILAGLLTFGLIFPGKSVCAAPIDGETVLSVAVHVSEYTRSQGLSLERGNSSDYAWRYYQIYTLLEETLSADGTPFVEVSDADITGGGLLTSSGNPKYPILISLAAECISDAEAQGIRSYVSKGGFAYVGSSSWTRKEDGSLRTSFALSTEMGLNSVAAGVNNWISIGDTGSLIRKVADHRLVNHLTSGISMKWALPDSYQDTMKLFADGSAMGHRAWNTICSTATPLVSIEGSNAPFLAVKQFNSGQFIYQAELSPLAGWGEANVVLLEYMFFRKAVEWAFATQGLPLVRISAWPYPYQAAFITRHDDTRVPPSNLILQEEQKNVRGQYYIMTGMVDPSVMPQELASDQAHQAIIGSHSVNHVAPDNQSYSEAFANINDSLTSLQNWTGQRPATWVAPYFGAILDQSFQAIQDSGVLASGGEQSIGPFPHYALSMTQEKKHYNFVEIPATFWIAADGASLLSGNDGAWSSSDIHKAVDLVYSSGGLINLYDHVRSTSSTLACIDYANTKSQLWVTSSEEIAQWWGARSKVQISCNYTQGETGSSLNISAYGGNSSLITLDILAPSSSPVSVALDGAPSSNFQQKGSTLKVNSGNAQSIVVSWFSGQYQAPIAAPDNYTVNSGSVLSVAAPGVLANDKGTGKLSAIPVTSAGKGVLNFKPDGAFTYTPAAGYSGIDSFTYKVNNGQMDSDIATVTITVNSLQVFSITASAGDNGSITPSGSVSVRSGESHSFTITPKAGYRIDTLTIDNASVTPVKSYTFSKVAANHTISATFTRKSSPPVNPGGGGGSGGVGGGGSVISPPRVTLMLDGLEGSSSLITDLSGNTQGNVRLKNKDGRVALDIAQGTLLKDAAGTGLKKISLSMPALPASPANAVILNCFDLSPEGANFTPELTLSVNYDPSGLPVKASEKDLYLACWDGENWAGLESLVDTQTKTVTTRIAHFSQYALLAKLPQLSPAKFNLSDIRIVPAEVNPGTPVTVEITVSNTGELPGKLDVKEPSPTPEPVLTTLPVSNNAQDTAPASSATIPVSETPEHIPGIVTIVILLILFGIGILMVLIKYIKR